MGLLWFNRKSSPFDLMETQMKALMAQSLNIQSTSSQNVTWWWQSLLFGLPGNLSLR
jgi:hypothetical protein